MSSSHELYNRLSRTLFALVKGTNRKQVANRIWIVVGVLQSNALALSHIATHLPMKTTAEARVTLIRRWLKNFRVEVWTFYEPILNHVFQGWHAVEAILILDGVLVFGDRWPIFRVSLRHGCRAIPLGWVVLAGKGVTSVDKLEGMLTRVARFLRGRVKRVIFLADRGFRDCAWADLCRKLRWNYTIRVMNNTYVTLPDGRFCRIDRLGVPQGQRRYFQNVLLTRDAKLRTNSTCQEQAVKRKDPGLLGSFRAIHGSEATGGFEPPNEGFAGRQTHPPTPLFAIRSITTQVPPTQPQNFGMENLIRSLFDLGLDSSINSPD